MYYPNIVSFQSVCIICQNFKLITHIVAAETKFLYTKLILT